MYRGRSIAVIVPAFREERLIQTTLRRVPDWVDQIIVIDDASDDATSEQVLALADRRVRLIRHRVNRGVGASLASGYREAVRRGSDAIAVMAGDAQMDPEDLPALLAPVLDGGADYAKGNRFLHQDFRAMPTLRRWAGRGLAWLTRRASGLDVDDSQCGYTVLSGHAARQLPWDELWPRYGYPNDLLMLVAGQGFRVAEVAVRPVYASEHSGVRPWHLLTVCYVILRRGIRQGLRPAPAGE